MGDVTGNGIIDGVDASTVLTAYAKSSVGKDMGLSDLQQKMSDVNADKKIDGNDATIILSYYAYSSVDNEPMTLAEFIKARG